MTRVIQMKSFERFLSVMIERLANLVPAAKLRAMKQLNPQRIYVENVRSIFGTPTWVARLVCETAVKHGIFVKNVQILCPDGAVAETVPASKAIPLNVRCWEEHEGDLEQVKVSTDGLQRLEVYALSTSVGDF